MNSYFLFKKSSTFGTKWCTQNKNGWKLPKERGEEQGGCTAFISLNFLHCNVSACNLPSNPIWIIWLDECNINQEHKATTSLLLFWSVCRLRFLVRLKSWINQRRGHFCFCRLCGWIHRQLQAVRLWCLVTETLLKRKCSILEQIAANVRL